MDSPQMEHRLHAALQCGVSSRKRPRARGLHGRPCHFYRKRLTLEEPVAVVWRDEAMRENTLTDLHCAPPSPPRPRWRAGCPRASSRPPRVAAARSRAAARRWVRGGAALASRPISRTASASYARRSACSLSSLISRSTRSRALALGGGSPAREARSASVSSRELSSAAALSAAACCPTATRSASSLETEARPAARDAPLRRPAGSGSPSSAAPPRTAGWRGARRAASPA